MRMLAQADIVKLSDEDLHWLMGAGDLVVLARQIIAMGPKLVFLTEGAKGARAVTAGQERFVAAQKVMVADTVGAGDTFNAGVLAALHQAGAFEQIADRGAGRCHAGRRPFAGRACRCGHGQPRGCQPTLGARSLMRALVQRVHAGVGDGGWPRYR